VQSSSQGDGDGDKEDEFLGCDCLSCAVFWRCEHLRTIYSASLRLVHGELSIVSTDERRLI
jgi:hypothetical protein